MSSFCNPTCHTGAQTGTRRESSLSFATRSKCLALALNAVEKLSALDRKKSNDLVLPARRWSRPVGWSKIHQLTNLELVARHICLRVTRRRLNASERICVAIWQTSPLLSVHGIAVNQAGSTLLILLLVKNDTVLGIHARHFLRLLLD